MKMLLPICALASLTLVGACSASTGSASKTDEDAGPRVSEGGNNAGGVASLGNGGVTSSGGSGGGLGNGGQSAGSTGGEETGGGGSTDTGGSNGSGGSTSNGGSTDTGGSGVGGNGPCYQLGASGMHPCAADTACSAPQYAEPGDGTVTTTCCSLTWQQVVDAQDLDWNDAVTYCKNLSLAGGGWRLPTIGELESMLDHCESTPTVDRTAFPNTRSDLYWSSTTTDAIGDVWVAGVVDVPANMSGGVIGPNTSRAVRCVR